MPAGPRSGYPRACPAADAPRSSSPRARAPPAVAAKSASSGENRYIRQASCITNCIDSTQQAGHRSVANASGSPSASIATRIERPAVTHGPIQRRHHHAGDARLRQSAEILTAGIVQVVGRDHPQLGGHRRAADRRVGIGMDLRLQAGGRPGLQDATRLLHRVVAVVAVDVAEFGQPLLGDARGSFRR